MPEHLNATGKVEESIEGKFMIGRENIRVRSGPSVLFAISMISEKLKQAYGLHKKPAAEWEFCGRLLRILASSVITQGKSLG